MLAMPRDDLHPNSPQKSHASSVSSNRRRRIRLGQQQQQQQRGGGGDALDDISTLSGASIRSTASSRASRTRNGNDVAQLSARQVVRGAGASSFAVQDAGSYQMHHDECKDLCATILTKMNPVVAVQAALDLALVLSDKKVRSILWQGDMSSPQGISSPTSPKRNVSASSSFEFDAVDDVKPFGGTMKQNDTNDDKGQGQSRSSNENTILALILDVIGAAARASSGIGVSGSENRQGPKNGIDHATRTKSKRRKNKQLISKGSGGASGGGAISAIMMLPQMRQALAGVVHFISLDCVIPEDINAPPPANTCCSPDTARKLRRIILKHPTALLGAMRLVLSEPSVKNASLCVPSSQDISAVSSIGSRRGRVSVPSHANSVLATLDGGHSVPKSVETLGRKPTDRAGLKDCPPSPSNSSKFSFSDDASLDSNEQLGGSYDPTAAGRMNRRRKKRLLQAMSPVQEDDFDFGDGEGEKRPKKRTASSNASAKLSFTSDDPPSTPPRRAYPGGSRCSSPCLSPTSLASEHSVSTSKPINEKLGLLVDRVLKKKGTSQNQSSIDHDASCEHLGLVQTDGMWLGRIVLEAIKLFASWEGYVDEENQDDMIQDEQNNPILLTNRLLGKSGIIPLLSRGVNQSLSDLIQLTSSVDRERFRSGTICKACLDTSHSEATALLSLIDNASLLNESNRRLLCEEDPFSFEKQNKGLVYSLLNAAKGMHEILSTGDGLNLPDDSVEHLRDMSVLTLRTLNSITHENGTAAEQMVAKNKIEPTDGDASFCGLNVVANLFYELEGASAESLYDSNHRFDAMNSCLISLTNIVGAAEMDVRKLISELEIPSEDESWLQWLCRWMINQTGSFQDAILGKDQKSEGDLHSKEEERLLAAGFACFLLASLGSSTVRLFL